MSARGPGEVRIGEQHKPLRVLVLDALRAQIVSGVLEPGTRLVEDQIARDLGVSRNPVREALRGLEAEGLVEMSPRRGAVVAVVSETDAEFIFEVREELESFAARLAARRAQRPDVARLRQLLASAERALGKGDATTVAQHNTRFHAALYGVAGNSYLAEMVAGIADRMEWIFRQNAAQRGPGSLEEHGAIVDAIAEGNEGRAAELAALHVRAAHAAFVARARRTAGLAAP